MNRQSFNLRTRIWIEDQAGRMVFGLGRLKILETINRTGSINAAAKELGMSYKAVWKRIKVTEERLGKTLLIKKKGGASGGSSELSEYAHLLIEKFNHLHDNILKSDDQEFEKTLRFFLDS